MDDPEESQFEIIEDEPPGEKPKRKRKRKYRPLFGHMPWRLLAITFIGGILVASLILGSLLVITSSSSRPPTPVVVTSAAVVTPLIATRAADDPVFRAAWAGDVMAAASGQSLRVYPGIGNAPIFLESEGYPEALTVSPDKKQVAVLWTVNAKTATDAPDPYQPIDIWDATSGQIIRRIDAHVYMNGNSAYGSPTAALAYSPDSTLLASSAKDGKIRIWDMQTGSVKNELQTDGASSTLALAFTADGQHFAAVVRYGEGGAGTHDELRVWNTSNYQPELGVNLQLQILSDAAFSPDGSVLGLIADGGDFIELRDTLSGAALGRIMTGADGIARAFALGSDNRVGVLYFRAGVATPEAGQPGGNHMELRALQWKRNGTSPILETETLASKTDYLNLTEIANLHFEPDNQWLDYVPYSSGNTMLRWNLSTSEISPFGL